MSLSPTKYNKKGGAAQNSGASSDRSYATLVSVILLFSIFCTILYMSHTHLDIATTNSKKFMVNSINSITDWEQSGLDKVAQWEQTGIEQIKSKVPPSVLHLEQSVVDRIRAEGEKAIEWEKTHLLERGGLSNIGGEFESIKEQPAATVLRQNMIVDTSAYKHSLNCPYSELMEFWKAPTLSDLNYRTPYADYGPQEKYVTFEPDVGGWNNIRMQMELVLVFAYSTGRTLVLPPDQPMYLLNAGKGHQKAHSFADFFPFEHIGKRLPVITMEEFMAREAVTGNLRRNDNGKVQLPPQNKTVFDGTERDDRRSMWFYLRNVSACPHWKSMKEFLVIPPRPHLNVSEGPNAAEYISRRNVFGAGRLPQYYDDKWQNEKVIHFISLPGEGYRLLEHFYTFIHFEDPAMDRLYKRFVRDYVHYIDIIFCKAALIVNDLRRLGNGSFSSFHIRRGEFQYKEVKIPADEMLANVGDYIPKGQLLFLATDERNKTFFKPFFERFPQVKFLDDYMDMAGLRNINPNFLGMIDQVCVIRFVSFICIVCEPQWMFKK